MKTLLIATGVHRDPASGTPRLYGTSGRETLSRRMNPVRLLKNRVLLAPVSGCALLIASLLAVHAAPAATVTVFAAASLTDALREIGADYTKKTGDRVVFNFAASSTLARQIEEGAPADLYFSADDAQMDTLERKGFVIASSRRERLANTLVVVVAARDGAPITNITDLGSPSVTRIAIADPRAVPAGVYARHYLEQQKLWTAIQPKVAPTENVRAALAVVEAGNADAALVYRTDAAISTKVKVAVAISQDEGPAIRYPVALLKSSRRVKAARRLLEYLLDEEAGNVFARYGFLVLPAAPLK